MVSDQRSQSKTVCVIGAGPSGLVAARELRRELHKVVVMEQSHEIGGQWLYSSETRDEAVPLARYFSTDSSVVVPRVHSSVYASLRLTSPREIMGYTDFPFAAKKGRDMRRFPGHRELLLYLKDFCDWFGLRELIRFDTKVEYVGMADNNGCRIGEDLKWLVRSRAVAAPEVVEEIFDAVVVATGHYTQPRLPKNIKGMDSWRRRQIHSHTYRVPIPFRDEVVVIVGNSLSGQDISMELVEVAKQVHLSSKTLDVTEGLSRVISKHKTLHLRPQIDRLCDDGRVVFVDGSCVEADTIIYCTGYSYSFPFLDSQGTVTVDDDRVGPLYEHTFPPSLAPSLSFIGIPRKLIGFPFFEAQAKWVAQLLSGKKTLPSYEDMMLSIKEYYHSMDAAGIPKHNTHDIANFEYCDRYCDQAGFPRLEQWRKDLCISALENAATNLETYRDLHDDDAEVLQVAMRSAHFTQIIEPDLSAEFGKREKERCT